MSQVALGVDVSLARGLDVVALDESGTVVAGPWKVTVKRLPAMLRAVQAGVVAIDSPPAWASTGRSREIERRLMKAGISIYATPSDPAGRRFYDWMREGFKVFAAARSEGYALYTGGPVEGRHAIEVFPHASAVTLLERLPSNRSARTAFRRRALEFAGVGTGMLTTPDQLDAALAALTGIRFLQRRSCHVGVAGEAVLVLPVAKMHPARYRKDSPAASA